MVFYTYVADLWCLIKIKILQAWTNLMILNQILLSSDITPNLIMKSLREINLRQCTKISQNCNPKISKLDTARSNKSIFLKTC